MFKLLKIVDDFLSLKFKYFDSQWIMWVSISYQEIFIIEII